MSDLVAAIQRLKSEIAALRTEMSVLEFDLFRSRKTIDALLGQDLHYSDENARLKEALSDAHRQIRWDCDCKVCREVDQTRAEWSGQSPEWGS